MTSARERYEELLIQLHLEMKAERGHTELAATIRDEMNECWHDLDGEDRELFDELSEDLYIIEGKRIVAPLVDGETLESVLSRVALAFKEHRGRETLACLRKLADWGPQFAYVFGRSWESLGFHRGALCFFDYAYSLQQKPVFLVSALEAIIRSGQMDQALRRIDDLEKGTASPTLLLESATVLHRAVLLGAVPGTSEVYERIIRLVEDAWIDESATPALRANALMRAGFAYEHLHKSVDASRAFERAVAMYPTDATFLAHGLAILPSNRKQAFDLFKKAARQRTRVDWPYLYIAQQALEENRFVEVEEFCQLGLAVIERPELRGRLYEWSAIAAASLGRSREEVIRLFDQAMAELPFDQTIRRNLEAFDRSINQPQWLTQLADQRVPSLLTLEQELPQNALAA